MIGDPSETDMSAGSNQNFIILIFIYFLLIYICWNNILGHVGFRVSLMKHVEVSDEAPWSPMKPVEVSDGSPIRHVGLRWVSNSK